MVNSGTEKVISEWLEDRRFISRAYKELLKIARGQVCRLRPTLTRVELDEAAYECASDGINVVMKVIIVKHDRGDEKIAEDALLIEIRKLASAKVFGGYSNMTKRWIERQEKSQKWLKHNQPFDDDSAKNNVEAECSRAVEADADFRIALRKFKEKGRKNTRCAKVIEQWVEQERDGDPDKSKPDDKVSVVEFHACMDKFLRFVRANIRTDLATSN